MNHHKAFKFRIYPTKEQIILIHKTLGCTRFVFNFFLSKQQQKDAYWHICEQMVQNGQLPQNNWKGAYFHKYTSIKDLKELKQHYPFLKEVDSIALQKSVVDIQAFLKTHQERDHNASINILQEAKRLLSA